MFPKSFKGVEIVLHPLSKLRKYRGIDRGIVFEFEAFRGFVMLQVCSTRHRLL